MAKYVFLYGGGEYPETEEQSATVMAAWSEWMASAGDKLIDGGNPIGQKRTIASDGSITDGGSPINGYSLYEAASLDDAVAFAKGCPHLDAGGTVEVGEAAEM
jgi:hypothetical protein